MTTLRIGLAQTRQTDDLATNATAILKYLDQAAAERVQILCFPTTCFLLRKKRNGEYSTNLRF